MLLENDARLVMFGDSVTDCGRLRPTGEGSRDKNLGDGYVSLVDALLQTAYPASRIRVVNMGVSGDTSRDLLARWEEDIMQFPPNWLSIMIGVNDVWRQFDEPCQTERHVYAEEYAANIEELLKRCAAAQIRAVLLSPFFAEPNQQDTMRQMCDQYAVICRNLAQQYGVLYGDTQAAFDRYLLHNSSMRMTWDRVHPNLTGHMLIAETFLETIGYHGTLLPVDRQHSL